MPIPRLLTVERSKLKRAKSDETEESERFFADDDTADNDSLLSAKPPAPRVNLVLIIFAIFGIGFTVGQILPPLLYPSDTHFIALESDEPSPSPTKEPTFAIDFLVPTFDHAIDTSPFRADSTSILEAFQEPNLTLAEKTNLLPSPDFTNHDMVAHYSTEAHQKLQDKLQPESIFRICINGGSSSAGGGHVDYGDLFFVQFAAAIESKYEVVTDIVNRAHGDRTSMHSAMLGDTFFTPNVDLLIWEFSINDQQDGSVDARNELILWLHKVKDVYGNEPPLVVLVYLWNKPFTTRKDGDIISDVYKFHAQLAAEYEFVIGHVNLATYVNSLHWKSDDVARHFLADAIHPNQLSHAAISKLMVGLVDNELQVQDHTFDSRTELEWVCGEDMQEQWRIQTVFHLGYTGGMAKAGFTAEIPRTTHPILPRILMPHEEYKNGTVDYNFRHFDTQRYGKAASGRIDRHRGVVLPFCDDGKLVFPLTEHAPLVAFQFLIHAKEGIDGGNLGRRLSGSDPKKVVYDDIEIVVNDQDYTTRIISARDWNCLLSNEMFSEWIVMDDKDGDFADEISFCSKSGGSTVHTLEHLVAF